VTAHGSGNDASGPEHYVIDQLLRGLLNWLVVASIACGLISVVLFVIEYGQALRGRPAVFRVGALVLREPITISPPALVLGHLYRTRSARVRLISPWELIFVQDELPGYWQIRRMIPIKGRIRWSDSGAVLEGRAMLCPTIALVAWIIAFVLMLMPVAIANPTVENIIAVLGADALAATFVGGTFYVSCLIEVQRLREGVDEIRSLINGCAAPLGRVPGPQP
jgi:hypothetical protein